MVSYYLSDGHDMNPHRRENPIATGYRLDDGDSGVRFPASRLPVGLTQRPIQSGTGVSFPRGKAAGA